MTNYSNFLKPIQNGGRGNVPYCFKPTTALYNTFFDHYIGFKTEYKNLMIKYKIDTILDEITIGGSSLTKINPPDLDLVKYSPESEYLQIIDHFEKIFNSINKQEVKDKIGIKDDAITRISNGIKNSREAQRQSGAIDLNCMISVKSTNPMKLYFFASDIKQLVSLKNLNVSDKKIFDFHIYRSSQSTGIPPELTIKL